MLENNWAGETAVFNVQGGDHGGSKAGVEGADLLLLLLLQGLQRGAHQVEMGKGGLTRGVNLESRSRGGRCEVKVDRPLLLLLLQENDRAGEKTVFNVEENLLCSGRLKVEREGCLLFCSLLYRLH